MNHQSTALPLSPIALRAMMSSLVEQLEAILAGLIRHDLRRALHRVAFGLFCPALAVAVDAIPAGAAVFLVRDKVWIAAVHRKRLRDVDVFRIVELGL